MQRQAIARRGALIMESNRKRQIHTGDKSTNLHTQTQWLKQTQTRKQLNVVILTTVSVPNSC